MEQIYSFSKHCTPAPRRWHLKFGAGQIGCPFFIYWSQHPHDIEEKSPPASRQNAVIASNKKLIRIAGLEMTMKKSGEDAGAQESSAAVKPKYLTLRGDTYYFHRRIPTSVVESLKLGSQHMWRSL
jgi:hypothetical protein